MNPCRPMQSADRSCAGQLNRGGKRPAVANSGAVTYSHYGEVGSYGAVGHPFSRCLEAIKDCLVVINSYTPTLTMGSGLSLELALKLPVFSEGYRKSG